ncbi:MAG: hypothetical protein M1829_001801 [Trizodia sp. TS-e1964]|nr:MAG: hypothetical protein M1829_001801 [Trizodia sp. TS-e1964]
MGKSTVILPSTPLEGTIALSPLDQIMPKCYTRLILGFDTAISELEQENTTKVLESGLQRLVNAVPALAGKIAPADRGAVAVYPSSGGVGFKVCNLTTEFKLSYEELRQKNFPLSAMSSTLAPFAAFLGPDEEAPVMAAQVNYIKGGMLLCVAIHHSFADGMGAGTLIKWWAAECRDDTGSTGKSQLTPELIASSLDRSPLTEDSLQYVYQREHPEYTILPPVEESAAGPPVDQITATPPADEKAAPPPADEKAAALPVEESADPLPADKTAADAPANEKTDSLPPTLPPMKVCLFHFSTASLTALKTAASNPKTWISTNDALCALLWGHISLARTNASYTPPPRYPQKLAIALNGRTRLQPALPTTYIGNVNLYPLATRKLVHAASLADLAREVRRAILAVDSEHVRSVLALVRNQPDVSRVVPGFDSFLGHDLAITSWVEMGVLGTEWAGVGRAAVVRVPVEGGWDGLCILLPGGGGLDVAVGLRSDVMAGLEKDEEFARFCHVVKG